MLRLGVQPWTHPSCSLRFASQLSRRPTATTSRPASILSRSSDRAQSKVPPSSDAEQKSRTSFVSAQSARQRDANAAEKWFTDIRKLDINTGGQPESNDLNPLPYKKPMGYELSKKHEMRPWTDLNALFSSPTSYSAASWRLQNKRELGGDYSSYLPAGYADPHRAPIDYARLALGRNRHILLNAKVGALSIIEGVIRGRTARQNRTT